MLICTISCSTEAIKLHQYISLKMGETVYIYRGKVRYKLRARISNRINRKLNKKISETLQKHCRHLFPLAADVAEALISYFPREKLCRREKYINDSNLADEEGVVSSRRKLTKPHKSLNKTNPFRPLPSKVIAKIFLYLEIQEWAEIQKVCRRWYYCVKEYSRFPYSCLDFSMNKYKGCDERILRNFLYNASRGSNSPHVKYLSLQRFISNDSEDQCMRLLNKSKFIRLFKNLQINNLIILRTTTIEHTFFRDLVPVIKLKVYKQPPVWEDIYMDLLLQNQPQLEVLRLHGPLRRGKCIHTVQHYSLRFLQIHSSVFSTGIVISFLRACPNLEYYGFSVTEKDNFLIENFSYYVHGTKLKFLGFNSFNIKKNSRYYSEPYGWPKSLTSLSLIKTSWLDYNLVSGSLENLECLRIGSSINVSEFFDQYRIGRNLQLLHIHTAITDEDICIWERCPAIKYISISHASSNTDKFLVGILNHCSKLEIIELQEETVSDEVLLVLSNKKGLKRICFVEGYSKHRIDRLNLGNISISAGSILPTMTWG